MIVHSSATGDTGPFPTGRMPWTLRHVALIVLLTIVEWAVVLAAFAIFRANSSTIHTIDVALVLVFVLYDLLFVNVIVVTHSTGATLQQLGFRWPSGRAFLTVLAIVPVWYGLLALVSAASAQVLNHGQPLPSNTDDLFGPEGLAGIQPVEIAAAIVLVAVFVPLVEETVFRGLLYQWLGGRFGLVAGTLASAALFDGAHFIPLLFPVLFVLGCVLTLIFQRTGSIVASGLLHGINNAVALGAVLYAASR